MRNKKILTLMLAFAFTSALGVFAACTPNNGFSSESSSGSDPMENVESLTSIPQSQLTVSAEARGVATSSWFMEYGTETLDVLVYVQDATVYKNGGNVFSNDYVELLVSKTQDESEYGMGTISVVVDATGAVVVRNAAQTSDIITDSGVTATVKEFTLNGNAVEGWYANIAIPYEAATISASGKDAAVCVGLLNADSKMSYELQYAEGIETVKDSVKTYIWLSDDNTYAENPYLYKKVDGISLDGKRDNGYGEFMDTVLLDDDRWYTMSATKTENGIVIYTQALFNTSTINLADTEADWGESTNIEFRLNGGDTSYLTLEDLSANVSEYFIKAEKTQDNKYLHTFEFFVQKDLIKDWTSDGQVQLNYAWKSPQEAALIMDDMIYCAYSEWNEPWHSYQRLGGLSSFTFDDGGYIPAPANLFISANGLTTVTPPQTGPVIDGNLTEYGTSTLTKGDEKKSTVNINGKVVNGDLYLALTITHGAWAEYSTKWYENDNLEMKINRELVRVMFFGDQLIIPANVDAGAAVTTTSGDKQITTVELYFAGDADIYEVKLGMAGNGFGGWQSIVWDGSDCAYISSESVTLDGNLNDSVYTQAVKDSAISANANGATVSVTGTKLTYGVLFGVTVTHTKAPDVSVNGETNWWNYMGVELHFNGNNNAYIATCLNARSEDLLLCSYCKTVDNGDGTYTSTFEIYVLYESLGVSATDTLNFSVGGWYENDWAWLWGGNATTPTHTVTENGTTVIAA